MEIIKKFIKNKQLCKTDWRTIRKFKYLYSSIARK